MKCNRCGKVMNRMGFNWFDCDNCRASYTVDKNKWSYTTGDRGWTSDLAKANKPKYFPKDVKKEYRVY